MFNDCDLDKDDGESGLQAGTEDIQDLQNGRRCFYLKRQEKAMTNFTSGGSPSPITSFTTICWDRRRTGKWAQQWTTQKPPHEKNIAGHAN
jgi:hypothetical protein